jgi:hypothetical protein
MSVILYKKGSTHNVRGVECTAQIWKDERLDLEVLEKAGWFVRPENIPAEGTDTENPSEDSPQEEIDGRIIKDTKQEEASILELSEDEIRQMAKDAKISHWHTKSIERLKRELNA